MKIRAENQVPLDILKDFFHEEERGLLLTIKVKPKSQKDLLFLEDADNLVLAVNAAAHENAANDRVREVLAALFLLPKSQVKILSGEKSRIKRIIFIAKKLEDIFA
jgi:uncharacterized protein (TIGR00251 family)